MDIFISARVTNTADGSMRDSHANYWKNVKDGPGADVTAMIAQAGADAATYAVDGGGVGVELRSFWDGKAQPTISYVTDDAGMVKTQNRMAKLTADLAAYGDAQFNAAVAAAKP